MLCPLLTYALAGTRGCRVCSVDFVRNSVLTGTNSYLAMHTLSMFGSDLVDCGTRRGGLRLRLSERVKEREERGRLREGRRS